MRAPPRLPPALPLLPSPSTAPLCLTTRPGHSRLLADSAPSTPDAASSWTLSRRRQELTNLRRTPSVLFYERSGFATPGTVQNSTGVLDPRVRCREPPSLTPTTSAMPALFLVAASHHPPRSGHRDAGQTQVHPASLHLTRTHRYNGLKTAVLLGGMLDLLLLLGYARRGTGSAHLADHRARSIGLAQTCYGFWNSSKVVALRQAHIEITEAQQPRCTRLCVTLRRCWPANTRFPVFDEPLTPSPPAWPLARRRYFTHQGILRSLNDASCAILGYNLPRLQPPFLSPPLGDAGIAGVISRWPPWPWFGGEACVRAGQRQHHPASPAALPPGAPGRRHRQFAISRTRRYDAKPRRRRAHQFSPGSALGNNSRSGISRLLRAGRTAPPDSAHSMITSGSALRIVRSLFAHYHPPMDKRIARLERWPGTDGD